jgi:hypothetical protein
MPRFAALGRDDGADVDAHLARAVAGRGRHAQRCATAAAGLGVTAGSPGGRTRRALGLLAVTVLVLFAWATAADAGSGPVEASRAAGHAWLLAHHVVFATPGGTVGLTPLGLMLLPAALLATAGARAVRSAGAMDLRGTMRAVAAMSATYAVLTAAVAVAATTDAVRPQPGVAVLAGLLLAATAGGAGGLRAAGLLPAMGRATPPVLRRVGLAGSGAAAALVAAGAAIAAASLAWHAGRVTELTRALDGGVSGGAAVTLIGALLAPNAAVWGASYALGPGFAVGVGTSVAPSGVTLGAVPALPVLGALPSGGGGWAWVVLAVPMVAGAFAGGLLLRAHRDTVLGDPHAGGARRLLRDAVAAGAVAGGWLTVLAALSGGPVGDGRLVAVGPSPWTVGLAAAVEVAVVRRARRHGRLVARSPTARLTRQPNPRAPAKIECDVVAPTRRRVAPERRIGSWHARGPVPPGTPVPRAEGFVLARAEPPLQRILELGPAFPLGRLGVGARHAVVPPEELPGEQHEQQDEQARQHSPGRARARSPARRPVRSSPPRRARRSDRTPSTTATTSMTMPAGSTGHEQQHAEDGARPGPAPATVAGAWPDGWRAMPGWLACPGSRLARLAR